MHTVKGAFIHPSACFLTLTVVFCCALQSDIIWRDRWLHRYGDGHCGLVQASAVHSRPQHQTARTGLLCFVFVFAFALCLMVVLGYDQQAGLVAADRTHANPAQTGARFCRNFCSSFNVDLFGVLLAVIHCRLQLFARVCLPLLYCLSACHCSECLLGRVQWSSQSASSHCHHRYVLACVFVFTCVSHRRWWSLRFWCMDNGEKTWFGGS